MALKIDHAYVTVDIINKVVMAHISMSDTVDNELKKFKDIKLAFSPALLARIKTEINTVLKAEGLPTMQL